MRVKIDLGASYRLLRGILGYPGGTLEPLGNLLGHLRSVLSRLGDI